MSIVLVFNIDNKFLEYACTMCFMYFISYMLAWSNLNFHFMDQ